MSYEDPYTNNVKVGNAIKNLRTGVGKTQRELAEQVGLHPSMLSRIENGRLRPNEHLQAIISALQMAGAPREELDTLFELAGYHSTDIFEKPVASKVILPLQNLFERLQQENLADKAWLENQIQMLIAYTHSYRQASEQMSQRNWLAAHKELNRQRPYVEAAITQLYFRLDAAQGHTCFSNGFYNEAIHHYQSAYWHAHQIEDKRKQAQILMRLGSVHRRRGGIGWATARQRYEEALDLYRELNDPDQEAICWRRIGGTYLLQGRPDKGQPLIEKSLDYFRQTGDIPGIYKGLQHLGWTYDLLGRWTEASDLHEQALKLIESNVTDVWELAKAYLYLADAYRLERRRQDACEYYKKAYDIFHQFEPEGSGVKLIIGMIFLGLGKAYLKIPGHELEARTYLNKSLEVSQELGEDFKLAEILSEQGDLLFKLGFYKEAEVKLKHAAEKLKELGNDFYYATALVSLGNLYYQRGRYHELNNLINIVNQLEQPGLLNYQLAYLELLNGQAFVAERSFPSAFSAFSHALSHAIAFNVSTFIEIRDQILISSENIDLNQLNPFFGQLNLHFDNLLKKSPEHKELIHESQQLVIRRQRELDAFRPLEIS